MTSYLWQDPAPQPWLGGAFTSGLHLALTSCRFFSSKISDPIASVCVLQRHWDACRKTMCPAKEAKIFSIVGASFTPASDPVVEGGLIHTHTFKVCDFNL